MKIDRGTPLGTRRMGSEDEVETGDRKDAVEADNLSVFEKYSKSKRKSKKKKKMVLKAAEREGTKWGKDVFSEEDYPIKRSFLYNLYDACKLETSGDLRWTECFWKDTKV